LQLFTVVNPGQPLALSRWLQSVSSQPLSSNKPLVPILSASTLAPDREGSTHYSFGTSVSEKADLIYRLCAWKKE